MIFSTALLLFCNAMSPGKTVLKPRNPGEQTKVNEVVLKRRDMNLKHKAEQSKKIAEEKKKKRKSGSGVLPFSFSYFC